VVAATIQIISADIKLFKRMIPKPTLPLMKPGRPSWMRRIWWVASGPGLALLALTLPMRAAAAEEQTFAAPQDAGFALVAWPAQWGNTGVMTFIVNQQGKVHQKNLGPGTAKIAGAMNTYDPDDTWIPVR